jgi:hypothetical protein
VPGVAGLCQECLSPLREKVVLYQTGNFVVVPYRYQATSRTSCTCCHCCYQCCAFDHTIDIDIDTTSTSSIAATRPWCRTLRMRDAVDAHAAAVATGRTLLAVYLVNDISPMDCSLSTLLATVTFASVCSQLWCNSLVQPCLLHFDTADTRFEFVSTARYTG